jgi:hypothetical protein
MLSRKKIHHQEETTLHYHGASKQHSVHTEERAVVLVVPDSKLWKMDAARAKLIFFAIELSGCLGPEAQGLCKVMAGAEGLKSIYESLSIGFQVNRALRIEHMMNDEAQIVLGLGVELLLSLIHFLGDYSVSCEV